MRIADKGERVELLQEMKSDIQEERKVNFRKGRGNSLIKEERIFFCVREG